jgi:hypothetical protein
MYEFCQKKFPRHRTFDGKILLKIRVKSREFKIFANFAYCFAFFAVTFFLTAKNAKMFAKNAKKSS